MVDPTTRATGVANTRGRATAQQAARADRRSEAIRLRLRGATWETVATECGYSDRGAACKDVGRELQRRQEELNLNVDQLREVEAARLDSLALEVWDVLDLARGTRGPRRRC